MWKQLIKNFQESVNNNLAHCIAKCQAFKDMPEHRSDWSYWEGKRDTYTAQQETLERLVKEKEEELEGSQVLASDFIKFNEYMNEYDFKTAKEALRTWSLDELNQIHVFYDRCLETLNVVRDEKKSQGRVTPAPESEK